MRSVMRELSKLNKNSPEGIHVQTSDEDMLDVTDTTIEDSGALFLTLFNFTTVRANTFQLR